MAMSGRYRTWAAALAAAALILFFAASAWPPEKAEAVLGGAGNLSSADNPHNLSSTSNRMKAVLENEICVFCHTPHNADKTAALIDAPLWNHSLSTVAAYTVKTPGTYADATVGTVVMKTTPPSLPDGTSRLCLSCHDGTIAIGSVRSESAIISMTADTCIDADGSLKLDAACPMTIGTDLTTKHVVSIPMNSNLLADSNAECPAPQTRGLAYPWSTGNGDTVMLRPTNTQYGASPGVTVPPAPSPKYKAGYYYGVQCSTCHDPHYWVSGTTLTVAGQKFLVASFNTLCSACHTAACN